MRNLENVQVRIGSSFETVCPFPVGYIYQSYSSTSPANIYGGSWIAITGRFLYCNSNTSTGGANSHKLSENEMPSHNHQYTGSHGWDWLCYNGIANSRSENAPFGWVSDGQYGLMANDSYFIMSNVTAVSKGGSAAHNNMPAYQTCYAWRRTS